MYKRPEIRASLEIILSVFTVTVLIFAAIRPTLTNVTQLQKKITDQEVVSKKADSKISQLLNAEKQLGIFSGSLRLFNEAVPDKYTYTDGAKRLEYVARKNGVTVDTMSFSGFTLFAGSGTKTKESWSAKISKPDANSILTDQVSFSVSGKPQNVITFIQEIENMDRLAAVNKVSLAKQIGLNKAEDTLKATGVLTFYFYSEKL